MAQLSSFPDLDMGARRRKAVAGSVISDVTEHKPGDIPKMPDLEATSVERQAPSFALYSFMFLGLIAL